MKTITSDVRDFQTLAQQAVDEPLPTNRSAFLQDLSAELLLLSSMAARHPEAKEDVRLLRARLMLEELGEVLQAMAIGDHVELVDGMCDLVYVTVGTAVSFGLPLERAWEAVQTSNMAKFPVCDECHDATFTLCSSCVGTGHVAILDASGKIVKPDGWTPPDILKAMVADGWE